MPAMKLTPNAAMRARDVSRPRAEHLAEAEAAEASAAAGSRARTGEAVNQARGEHKTKTPQPQPPPQARSGRDGPGSRDADAAAGRAEAPGWDGAWLPAPRGGVRRGITLSESPGDANVRSSEIPLS